MVTYEKLLVWERLVTRSRYLVIGKGGPAGQSELTEFRRTDGSRTYLVRERLEFWGPVLERFVVLTIDANDCFDSGHWVGTSDYSGDFRYSFRFDGRSIRGDWEGAVVGTSWNEVPSRPGNPLLGFWGPLESLLLLLRFDPQGPARQTFDAVDVEDTHHRQMTVSVERLGVEQIQVPAGRFSALHYRSERFGTCHHWIDEKGTVIRWASEGNAYRWDLDRYPSSEPLPRATQLVASGTYEVHSPAGGPRGVVPWSLEVDSKGGIRLLGEEHLDRRRGWFEGFLDPTGKWNGTSESSHWTIAEGEGLPEVHHFETFFFRRSIYVLRFRERAYPLLQSQPVGQAPFFHMVNYPIVASTWLRRLSLEPNREQRLLDFSHLGARYRGAVLELQAATAKYLGGLHVKGPNGTVPAHHFILSYPGGWVDSTFEYWTDMQFIPLRMKVNADEGAVEYELVRYDQASEEGMASLL